MASEDAGPGPVMLTAVTNTRLEKAATDNGFDLRPGKCGRLALLRQQPDVDAHLAHRRRRFRVSRGHVSVEMSSTGWQDLGAASNDLLPSGAAGALAVSDIAALHHLLRRAFQLSRTLPNGLLHVFETEIANLPRTTEAERLVVQRVGQDIFRRGLLEYWDGRCAITGLDVPDLLRASHIKPWADCDTDAERLDVFNGLTARASSRRRVRRRLHHRRRGRHGGHLGRPPVPPPGRPLASTDSLKLRGLHHAHERYLSWHRSRDLPQQRGA